MLTAGTTVLAVFPLLRCLFGTKGKLRFVPAEPMEDTDGRCSRLCVLVTGEIGHRRTERLLLRLLLLGSWYC